MPLPTARQLDTSRTTLPSRSRITPLAFAIYIPLAAGAFAWARFGQDRSAWFLGTAWLDAPFGARCAVSILMGGALALATVATTRALLKHAAWARELERELQPIIDPLSSTEVVLLAVVSGCAEELFFRGAMQPAIGLVATSVVFGIVHTGPKRVFVAWSLWAGVMGLLFGLIFELTGVLFGAVLAHVVINARNMAYMKRH